MGPAGRLKTPPVAGRQRVVSSGGGRAQRPPAGCVLEQAAPCTGQEQRSRPRACRGAGEHAAASQRCRCRRRLLRRAADAAGRRLPRGVSKQLRRQTRRARVTHERRGDGEGGGHCGGKEGREGFSRTVRRASPHPLARSGLSVSSCQELCSTMPALARRRSPPSLCTGEPRAARAARGGALRRRTARARCVPTAARPGVPLALVQATPHLSSHPPPQPLGHEAEPPTSGAREPPASRAASLLRPSLAVAAALAGLALISLPACAEVPDAITDENLLSDFNVRARRPWPRAPGSWAPALPHPAHPARRRCASWA